MYPEYLYNSDTQDICRRVSELACADEPALRAHCQEVSRQTDTSSLSLARDCAIRVNDADATLSIIGESAQKLSQSLLQAAGVFRAQDGKAHFAAVCRAVARIEEERLRLLSHVAALGELRSAIASSMAEANRTLLFLSLAKGAVFEGAKPFYAEGIACTQAAYARLIATDNAVREVQAFYMTAVERQLPAFMQRIRAAADFNHGGEALDTATIRALCGELLILRGARRRSLFDGYCDEKLQNT